MRTPQELLDRRALIARLTDEAVADFALDLADVIRRLERELRALVTDVADGSRTAIIKAARASRLRNEIRNLLTQAGFDDLLNHATDAPLDRLARAALATEVGKDVAQFVGPVNTRIAALKALTLSDLLGQGDQIAAALWRATVHGVFSARPVDAILEDLATLIDDTAPHLRTLYDTSISIYGRQVEQLTAGTAPDTLFVYVGPVDDVIRPFCLEWAGKVLARADIDALDNGQLPVPFLTGGGYNCRHSWVEIAKSSELAPLAGTDARMPEMSRAIARVRTNRKAA